MVLNEGWKKGPMPPNTWFWGGVVKVGDDPRKGFYGADFHGDYVIIQPTGERLEADQVAYYNNCLKLPDASFGTANTPEGNQNLGTRLGDAQ